MMNKGRKSNTSRGGGGGGGNNNNNRSSPRSRTTIAEGVYNNSHFLHAAASQVGNPVRVKTKGGVVVEGIFRTFSENFHIALEVPHRYQNGSEDKKINVDTVQDNLIIKLEDIVTIEAKDVDLDYATRDTFATDTAIASRSNGPNREKELQPWSDLDGPGSMNGGDGMSVTLELDTKTNGWDANEMFQLNEKEHGIKTTYKDNLESYTVQIERKDTQDYRRQELEAERIANEIENNPKTQERLEVENGDEEAAFAAVIRPEDSNNSSSTNSNSNNSNNNMNSAPGNSDKMTPPPQSHQPPPQQKYIPKQQRGQDGRNNQGGNNQGGGAGGKMMQNTKMYPKPMQSAGGPQQQQPVQQTIVSAGGFKTMTINPPVQSQFNQPPPSHYQQQQSQSQQQQHQRDDRGIDGKVNGGDSSNSSNSSSSNKSSMQQQQAPSRTTNMRIMNPIPVSFSEPPPPIAGNMGKPLNMHIPPPHLQSAADGQSQVPPQAIHVVSQPVVLPPTVVVAHPQIHQIHAAPQPQRPPRGGSDGGPIMRSRNDDMRQLRQFHNDFQIAPPPGQQQIQMVPQEIVVAASGPPSIENVHIGKPHQPPPQINHHVTHHPTPSSTPHQQDQKHGPSTTPPQANTPQQNVNSNNVNSNNNSTGSISSDTPGSTTSSANGEKAALGTKKFTLNPQAKPFTPRTPSTPTQSRPHTPQTPGPMVQQQQQQQQIPPPQQQLAYAAAPAQQLVYCLVPSQQRPTPPPSLARKTQFHQFQVTQATGQPIFNPPVPPQVMPYHPSQMQTVQSQTYPPAIRMYPTHDAQQQPHLTSYLVPTPPSTTPSPGQAHQPTFHPQASPATGPPTQAFQPQGQYVMLMPSNGPPFVYNQHNPQSFQIVPNPMPQQPQQHPQQ